MYLFQKIEEATIQYNDSKKVIATFLLENAERLSDFSMKEIAEETYTSKASLVRFAKKMGYKGWKDFIIAFKEEKANEQKYIQEVNPNIPFEEDDGYEVIANKLKILQVESLGDTFNTLDGSTLFRATKLLKDSENIMVFCISPYIYLADIFRRKMMTIGKNVIVANPLESSLATNTLSDDDCAIMISYSGNNEYLEPISHIKELKRRKVKLIGLTSGGENTLRNYSDAVLTISSRERIYSKIANFATEESINYLLNVLFSCYFKQNYRENLENKISNTIQIESEKRFTKLKNIQG